MTTLALVRPLRVGDLAACAALHRDGFGSAAWSETELRKTLAAIERLGWLECVDDQISGFIIIQNSGEDLEIITLVTATTHLRQGVATRLVEQAIRYAQTRHSNRLLLEVAADNGPAQQLYRKLGFTALGRRAGYYAREGKNMDAIVLALPIR